MLKKLKDLFSPNPHALAKTESAVLAEEKKLVESLSSPDESERIRALSRVTSELVKRVDRAERHPGERILDEAEFASGESRGEYSHRVECDQCGMLSVGAFSQERANERAIAAGWVVAPEGEKGDYCPRHKPGALLLNGQAPPAPKKPSPIEALLLVRLEWLSTQYLRERSPEAVVANSVHSGQRTMLTDIAQGDVLAFFERLGLLIETHPMEVPDGFREAGVAGQLWLHDLLTLVTAEDRT
jgi:hypothetical protein